MYKFVFEIKFKEGQNEQDYIDAWKRGSTKIQTFPGARGTILHRKIGEPTTLLAIATWDTKVARDAAFKSLSEMGQEGWEILHRHSEFGEISPMGGFEEIDRVDPE